MNFIKRRFPLQIILLFDVSLQTIYHVDPHSMATPNRLDPASIRCLQANLAKTLQLTATLALCALVVCWFQEISSDTPSQWVPIISCWFSENYIGTWTFSGSIWNLGAATAVTFGWVLLRSMWNRWHAHKQRSPSLLLNWGPIVSHNQKKWTSNARHLQIWDDIFAKWWGAIFKRTGRTCFPCWFWASPVVTAGGI